MLFKCKNFMFFDFTWKKSFTPGDGGGWCSSCPLSLQPCILATCDLNIGFSNSKMDTNSYLTNFINNFLNQHSKFENLLKTLNGTLLDIILTKKPKSFCQTCTIETGLSDR